jgi:hypothetical protein
VLPVQVLLHLVTWTRCRARKHNPFVQPYSRPRPYTHASGQHCNQPQAQQQPTSLVTLPGFDCAPGQAQQRTQRSTTPHLSHMQFQPGNICTKESSQVTYCTHAYCCANLPCQPGQLHAARAAAAARERHPLRRLPLLLLVHSEAADTVHAPSRTPACGSSTQDAARYPSSSFSAASSSPPIS